MTHTILKVISLGKKLPDTRLDCIPQHLAAEYPIGTVVEDERGRRWKNYWDQTNQRPEWATEPPTPTNLTQVLSLNDGTMLRTRKDGNTFYLAPDDLDRLTHGQQVTFHEPYAQSAYVVVSIEPYAAQGTRFIGRHQWTMSTSPPQDTSDESSGRDTPTHWANGEKRLLTPEAYERLSAEKRAVPGHSHHEGRCNTFDPDGHP